MSQKKPALLGRLAVQLKLISPQQLAQATAAHEQAPDKSFGAVLVDQGFVSDAQLAKLEKVQRDLIAKHRAKQAAAAGPTASPPPTATSAAVHGAAERAAQEASPVTAENVHSVSESPAPKPAAPVAPPPAAPAPQAPAAQVAPPPPAASVTQEESGPPSLELRLAPPDGAGQAQLHQILGQAMSAGASDIHLHGGGALKFRINGELSPQGMDLDRESAERLVAAALTPEEHARLSREGEIDLCLDVEGVGRFRANAYCQQRGFDLVLRSIPATPPTLEELQLPEELAKLTDYHQGMVLLTGPAGCGKSATLAALVNLVNERRDEHILTVEDPIEVIHPSKRCLVNQRDAGRHTTSFARALRGALREDPDIIVIGELRDLETISLAMTAAETGHFVLATLHTNNAVRTVNRMIGAFPAVEQGQVRAMLSESLRAVVSQRLLPKADGSGRVPALEVLVNNKAIGNLIRDEKTVQIRSAMQTGKAHGMYLLEQSMNEMVASGLVTRETALANAEEKKMITAGG